MWQSITLCVLYIRQYRARGAQRERQFFYAKTAQIDALELLA
jgi:hypothetical protein